jgi:hypothetical protein
MVHQAADEGKTGITWTTGDQQNHRYDLTKDVDRLTIFRSNSREHPGEWVLTGSKDGNDVLQTYAKDDEALADLVGHNVAKNLLNSHEESELNDTGNEPIYGEAKGAGLEVGGSGMRGFYDKILPDIANQLGKRYGVQVGQVPIITKEPLRAHPPTLEWKQPNAQDIPDLHRATWRNHLARRESADVYSVPPEAVYAIENQGHLWHADHFIAGQGDVNHFSGDSPDEVKAAIQEHVNNTWPAPTEPSQTEQVHYLPIPEHMRKDVLSKGFPLFGGVGNAGAKPPPEPLDESIEKAAEEPWPEWINLAKFVFQKALTSPLDETEQAWAADPDITGPHIASTLPTQEDQFANSYFMSPSGNIWSAPAHSTMLRVAHPNRQWPAYDLHNQGYIRIAHNQNASGTTRAYLRFSQLPTQRQMQALGWLNNGVDELHWTHFDNSSPPTGKSPTRKEVLASSFNDKDPFGKLVDYRNNTQDHLAQFQLPTKQEPEQPLDSIEQRWAALPKRQQITGPFNTSNLPIARANSAWLSPAGRFWDVYDHHTAASSGLPDSTDPIRDLQRSGYIQIGHNGYIGKEPSLQGRRVTLNFTRPPTDQQMQSIGSLAKPSSNFQWFHNGWRRMGAISINSSVGDKPADAFSKLENYRQSLINPQEDIEKAAPWHPIERRWQEDAALRTPFSFRPYDEGSPPFGPYTIDELPPQGPTSLYQDKPGKGFTNSYWMSPGGRVWHDSSHSRMATNAFGQDLDDEDEVDDAINKLANEGFIQISHKGDPKGTSVHLAFTRRPTQHQILALHNLATRTNKFGANGRLTWSHNASMGALGYDPIEDHARKEPAYNSFRAFSDYASRIPDQPEPEQPFHPIENTWTRQVEEDSYPEAPFGPYSDSQLPPADYNPPNEKGAFTNSYWLSPGGRFWTGPSHIDMATSAYADDPYPVGSQQAFQNLLDEGFVQVAHHNGMLGKAATAFYGFSKPPTQQQMVAMDGLAKKVKRLSWSHMPNGEPQITVSNHRNGETPTQTLGHLADFSSRLQTSEPEDIEKAAPWHPLEQAWRRGYHEGHPSPLLDFEGKPTGVDITDHSMDDPYGPYTVDQLPPQGEDSLYKDNPGDEYSNAYWLSPGGRFWHGLNHTQVASAAMGTPTEAEGDVEGDAAIKALADQGFIRVNHGRHDASRWSSAIPDHASLEFSRTPTQYQMFALNNLMNKIKLFEWAHVRNMGAFNRDVIASGGEQNVDSPSLHPETPRQTFGSLVNYRNQMKEPEPSESEAVEKSIDIDEKLLDGIWELERQGKLQPRARVKKNVFRMPWQ